MIRSPQYHGWIFAISAICLAVLPGRSAAQTQATWNHIYDHEVPLMVDWEYEIVPVSSFHYDQLLQLDTCAHIREHYDRVSKPDGIVFRIWDPRCDSLSLPTGEVIAPGRMLGYKPEILLDGEPDLKNFHRDSKISFSYTTYPVQEETFFPPGTVARPRLKIIEGHSVVGYLEMAWNPRDSVWETSLKPFADKFNPHRPFHFLLQLNYHYEGEKSNYIFRQASGLWEFSWTGRLNQNDRKKRNR